MSEVIRILIADDHQIVRQGLTVFLNTVSDFHLVGEASSGDEAIRLCHELRPDVVLMDMMMKPLDGVAATTVIRKHYPDTKIVALTSFTEDATLLQRALQAGVTAYLFKDVSNKDLAETIRVAHRGDPVLAPQAARLLIQAATQPKTVHAHLSEREIEVLQLMIEGLTNPQIAQRLTISRSTASFHVSSILGKLGVSNRSEAVALALQNKLVN